MPIPNIGPILKMSLTKSLASFTLKSDRQNVMIKAVADLRGGARDMRPPLWPKISSFSCSFREKLAK